MKKLLMLTCIMATLFTGKVSAETIGFVDLQKVFVNYKETQTAREGFEKKQEELKKELEKKQALLEKAQKDKKAPEEIQKLVEEIQEELQPKQEALIQLNNQLMGTIRADIIKATQKVAKDYGVDIVLDKQALLTGGFDLTDFVIDKLNN